MRISFFIVLFFYTFLSAESLYTISRYAIEQNYKIKSYEHNIKAKKYLLEQAKDNFYPYVSANGSYGVDRYHYNYPQEVINYDSKVLSYSLIVKQPLYQPKIYALIKDSKLKLKYAKLQKEAFSQEFLKEIATTYIDLLSNLAISKLYKKRSENYEEIVNEIKEKREVRFATESDFLQAMANLASARNDYIYSKLSYKNYLRKLEYLIQKKISLEKDVSLKDSVETIASLIKRYNYTIIDNPKVKLYKLNKDIAKNEIKTRQYEKYPTLNFTMSYSDTDSSDAITRRGNFRAFIELNVPIYNAVANDAKKEAYELFQAANYDYLDIINTLKIDYEKSIFDLHSYEEMLKKDKESIKSAKLFLEKAELGYSSRLISLSELYKAKNDYYYSLIEYEKHKAMLLKSYIEFLYVTGNINLTKMKEIEAYIKKEN